MSGICFANIAMTCLGIPLGPPHDISVPTTDGNLGREVVYDVDEEGQPLVH